MQAIINDTPFTIPSSLAEFTLGQRIDFQDQVGNELDEIAKSISEMPEGIDKDLEIAEFMFEKCFRTFGFFTGIAPGVLKSSEFVDDIAAIYYGSMQTLFGDEATIELQTEYFWKGEIWDLHPPELKQGSKMSFGEFLESKQMVKNLSEVGANKWEMMLPLAAIYLRRKDEAYQEDFIYDDSDRLKLMRDLPMDIALGVGFFLSSSLNFSINRLMSSPLVVAKAEDLQPSILTNTAGLISSKLLPKPKSLISRLLARIQ